MMLIKLSFIATPEMKQLFCVFRMFPGCGVNYIGKAERALYDRTVKHA